MSSDSELERKLGELDDSDLVINLGETNHLRKHLDNLKEKMSGLSEDERELFLTNLSKQFAKDDKELLGAKLRLNIETKEEQRQKKN